MLGLVNAQTIGKLMDFLAAHDTAAGLALINRLVADGVELGQLVDQIVAYLRGVLFVRVARAPEQLDLPQDVVAMMARQAETFAPAAILTALREFTEARAGAARPGARRAAIAHRDGFLARRAASAAEPAPVMRPRASGARGDPAGRAGDRPAGGPSPRQGPRPASRRGSLNR